MNEPTTTTYRPLPDTIKHREFTLTLVERHGDLAIYSKQWHSRKTPIFELIQIRRREAMTFPGSKPTPAREVYPSDNDWGQFGWTHVSLESAKVALGRLTAIDSTIHKMHGRGIPSDHPDMPPDGQSADLHAMPNEETAFRTLPAVFIFDLYLHELVERVGNVAIYAKSKGGNDPSFEVVRIRTVKERTWPDGRVTPPGEFYPSNEDWGQFGWTYNTIEAARAKMAEVAARRPVITARNNN